MKTRYKIIIIGISIPVAILGIMIFGPVFMMIGLNGYSGFMMSIISDESFEKDFAKIPEVKLYIEKYPNYTTNHSSDFLGWKIIDYYTDVSNNVVHLSIKKSVLHQGVKVSAGCAIASPSSYALNILDDKVMDYLKNDLCLEKKLPPCTSTRDACIDPPICKNTIWECKSNEKIFDVIIDVENTPEQLKEVFGNCACPERVKMNPNDNIACPTPFLHWQNSTHYIDNNICEWEKLK